MPVNERYPLSDVVEACRAFYARKRRRVFVEYVMLRGVNGPLRAGARARASARRHSVGRALDLQGQPDPVQPDRLAV